MLGVMPSQHAGKQSSIRLSDEQDALWKRLAVIHGGKKEAMLAGLRALDKGAAEPTPEQALAVFTDLVRTTKTKAR